MPKVTTPRSTRNSRGLRFSPVGSDSEGSTASRRSAKRNKRNRSAEPIAANASTSSSADNESTSVTYSSSSTTNHPTSFNAASNNYTLPTIREETSNPATPVAQIDNQSQIDASAFSSHDPHLSSSSSSLSPLVQAILEQAVNSTTSTAQNSHPLHDNITPSQSPGLSSLPFSPSILLSEPPVPGENEARNRTPLATKEEQELQETAPFLLKKAQEGYLFARKLYCAIRQDHKLRNCTCGSPIIYNSEEEAEAGRGHLRFYVLNSNPNNLRVLQRKDDLTWHCRCSRRILYKFEPYESRKRAAEDSEIDLIAQENGQDHHAGTIETVYAAANEAADEAADEAARVEEVAARSMWSFLAGLPARVATSMGATIDSLFGKLRARVSEAFDIVESRKVDVTNNSISVKRLKRQHCVSLEDRTAQDASRFEELPWFEWRDDPLSYFQGARQAITHVMTTLEGQVRACAEGCAHELHFVEAFKTDRKRPGYSLDSLDVRLACIDEDLSQAVHRFMVRRDEAGLPGGWDAALELYYEGLMDVVDFIKRVYLDDELHMRIRKDYARPPSHLYLRRYVKPPPVTNRKPRDHYSEYLEQVARKAGQFLLYLLTDENMEDEWRKIISMIIVDANAIHKNEMPPSFVELPEKTMPGSFPHDLVENVCMDGFTIDSPWEIRFPSSKSDTPRKTPLEAFKHEVRKGKERKYVFRPKGAVKTGRQYPYLSWWPFTRTPTPAKKKKVAFQSPAGQFVPPSHIPTTAKLSDQYRAIEEIAAIEDWADVRAKEEERFMLQMALEKQKEEERLAQEKVAEEERLASEKKAREEREALELRLEEAREMDEIRSRQRPTFAYPSSAISSTEWTKTEYAQFLAETREDMRKHPQFNKGSPEEEEEMDPAIARAAFHEETMRCERERGGRLWERYKAPLPPPPQPDPRVPDERRRRLELLMNDLELNERGEVVPREVLSTFLTGEADLMIATKKLDDLDLAHQLREEMQAAAVQRIKEARQKLEAEERRKREEERRRLEEEQRRREEEERRRKEEETRRQQEAQRRLEAEERARLSGLRPPTRSIISPISPEWEAKISQIAHANSEAELAKTLEGQALTRRDFAEKLLPPTAWLNDNIIIGSILYIANFVNAKAGATEQDPKCAAFTSYFWPRLRDAGVNQCGRLMRRAGVRKNNFFDIETILIPICSSSHWTLATVRPGQRTVAHMDSLRGPAGDSAVTARLLEWVKATLEEQYVAAEWKVVGYEAPRQTNGYDCGVFTITNAQCLALGLEPKATYGADQLALQRRRLAAVLLNGGFKGEFDMGGI